MSERTSAPANDPFTPETMHEARTLIALLRRLGVTTALSDADGNPTFIFSKDDGLDDEGLVAMMVENRWKAEEDFREAMKSALNEPSEAEKACGDLEEMGFLTAVIWSDGIKPIPSLAFELSDGYAIKPEALSLIDQTSRRFKEYRKFEDEMLDYLVGIGGAYEALRPDPVRNLPTAETSDGEGFFGSLAAKVDTPSGFDPVSEMEAAIEAKVEAAIAGGMDPALLLSPNASDFGDVFDRIGFTEQEQDFMAKRSVLNMVKVEVGRKIMETLNAANFRVVREDLIPSLTSYFEALDAGEIEAAA